MPIELKPPNFASPVRHVIKYAPVAPVTIAPEKAEGLRAVAADIKLNLTDEGVWRCSYDPATTTVTLSRQLFEIIWAASYAHLTFYTRIFEGRREEDVVVVRLDSEPDLKAAGLLLQWAFENWQGAPRQLGCEGPPGRGARELPLLRGLVHRGVVTTPR